MRIIKSSVYEFDELNDKAKEKAREWYRRACDGETDFADCVIEDAEQCAQFVGITFKKRDVKLMGGGTRQEPLVFWSGFSSRLDGARFEGTWRASDVKPGKLKEHAPQDTELHRIAAEFEKIAKRFPESSFTVRKSGHYSHKYCTEFDVEMAPDSEADNDTEHAALVEAARDFMEWIYRQLEQEHEYQNSDEQVDETFRANQYEFTAEGKRFP